MHELTPERWQRIAEIFDEALDLDLQLRPAFLEGACAGDPELRRQVEALLAADQEASEFLAGQAWEMITSLLPQKPEDRPAD